MATYYLSTSTGNDFWTGLSATFTSGSTGPWKTLAKALGASGMASGDILYIAPGTYNESVTIGFSPSAATQIIGDPNSQVFGGINAGPVLISAFNAAGTSETVTANLIIATGRSFFEWSNIWWKTTTGRAVSAANCRYWKFTNCVFENTTSTTVNGVLNLSSIASTALDATITRCRFDGGNYSIALTGGGVSDASSITSCVFTNTTIASDNTSIGLNIYNCSFIGCDYGVVQRSGSSSFPINVRNCLFVRSGIALQAVASNMLIENYNRFLNSTRVNMGTLGANSTTGGDGGLDLGYLLQTNGNYLQTYTPYTSSPNTAFGTATGAPATDLYNVVWNGASPDAGGITYRVITSLPSQVAYNGGVERNASTITIAPGSTSQSIELYLGATGLTASTSGLSARYNRTRTASVSIPLVARTIAQAWTAGGFAEVDVTNMPGVYRLDLPDAALAAGADDVTIVVRGASGTNGAVMTVKLSSGGLTSAQTASAVWGASPVGYNDATTFGGVVNQIDQTVTGIDSEVGDVPSMVWEELRANHTTAGSFGQYVNAELLTPITSAALVRMGPYEVKADGLGASDPLDIQKGAQHGVDIQCVDGNGNGIDITSATVTAKVYNSGASLVDTYSCTATYAADGRATFTIDTTVTNTPGTYTATITRTTGASDTQIFGPLRIYVRDI
jgi:hypothetical protein